MKLSTRLKGILVILGLLLLLTPASAQVTPQLSLYINWTPKEQLTTFNTDERFVTAQIYANTNVQFWAIDFNCRLGTGAELELVDITYPSGTWDTPEPDNQFLANPSLSVLQSRYNPTTAGVAGGFLALTITRVGNNISPVGTNGVSTQLPIANVRFKVKSRTTDAPVNTTCTVIRTLDRNGRQALLGRLGTFTHLFVRIGYTLKGTALRQGATNHLNIRVLCTHIDSGESYDAFTLSNGSFTFGGATITTQANYLRRYGLYECIYESDLNANFNEDGSDSTFLRAKSYINLTTPRYQLMPVTLRPGDFEHVTSPNAINVLHDLNIITGGTMGRSANGAFLNGDANGDNIVNQNDLALVAGNVGLSDNSAILSEHTFYSLGTDYNAAFVFPNSRVQIGTPESGAITRRNPASTTRDFWATVSPDGSEYAYTSVNAAGLHSLMIGNMATGAGVAYRLPVGFRYPHSLAPSWSPDGSLLAWICTVNNIDSGMQYNEGHLCYGNRGDTTGNSVTILLHDDDDADTVADDEINTEIFPPAWFSYPYQDGIGLALIYAYNNTLKYYDLTSNTSGTIADLPIGTADMPVVINHWSGDSFLFYRFNNAGTYRLHVAKLEPSNTYFVDANGLNFTTVAFGTAGTSTGTTNPVHMVVDDTANVEYYDVSALLDIMLYTDRTGLNLTNIYTNVDPDEVPDLEAHFWSDFTSNLPHFVDGNIGSPVVTSGIGGGFPWTGDEESPTMYHAQRVTFDWVP